MKNWIIAIFLVCLSANIYSQEKLIVLNAVTLDTSRYDEFIGKPYFFNDWSHVDVVSVGGVPIENVKANYNGLDGEWEIFHEGKYTQLPKNLYTKVDVTFDESQELYQKYPPKISFCSNVHPKLMNKYVIVLIDEPELKLYEQFYIVENINKKEIPGKTMTTKTLKRKSIYNIEFNGEFTDLKASKKGLTSVFGNKKKIDNILSNSKNKLKTSEDLRRAILTISEMGLSK